jgi:hypothetical protein
MRPLSYIHEPNIQITAAWATSTPIKQEQSIPTISGNNMPNGILQAVLYQQALI